MSYSRMASADTSHTPYEPILRAPRVAPADKAATSEVLITEQEVLFGTAAALPGRRRHIGRGFGTSMRRLFAVSARPSRPQRGDYPRRYAFLERSLMAREMGRL